MAANITISGLGCALPTRRVAIRQQKACAGVSAPVQMRKQQPLHLASSSKSLLAVVRCEASEERTPLKEQLVTDHAGMLSTSAVLGAGLWGLSPVAAALAEDAAEVAAEVLADPDSFLGLTQTGAVFATAPVILYGAFTVIRQEFNRNLKITDFFFTFACIVIFSNIGSIVFFKQRLF
mmetsp:Transcript_26510/g.44381  ORF Transcript_26510/g.44381 Transcript_26510/m.44381 type:complete len:178 (-) Transcript_26510:221-754(-)|eukprot:CAMPEP_0198196784 /NCGR_PEP_ID=MMETSP1445-20131203/225_1 /TAXON_ID=36898 /ORGANISM="Pyramimonas sp., Strain CCMP2087" /LENGTH=177 /DNA_ID=CAMNT_0043865767 /DNA_START=53 /DNA_END=586 /DNA_ORIENTATION=-